MLTRKDDLRRKLLLIRIICLRLITSSNDFTLETIGPTFSGGCSSTALLIDGIWEIIQGMFLIRLEKQSKNLPVHFLFLITSQKVKFFPVFLIIYGWSPVIFFTFALPFLKSRSVLILKKKKIWNTDVADHTKNKYPPPCSFSTLGKQLQSSVNR